jgi:hypothetical protein
VGQLSAVSLIYLALVVPLVAGAAWSVHRHAALPLLDLLDADEMLAAAMTRLVTVGYALLAFGLAVSHTPTERDLRAGVLPAVLSALAGLLLLLGVVHLSMVGLVARARSRRLARMDAPPRWVPPMAPPFMLQPPMPVPPMPVPPMPAPAYGPPNPPPPFDPWAFPRR